MIDQNAGLGVHPSATSLIRKLVRPDTGSSVAGSNHGALPRTLDQAQFVSWSYHGAAASPVHPHRTLSPAVSRRADTVMFDFATNLAIMAVFYCASNYLINALIIYIDKFYKEQSPV